MNTSRCLMLLMATLGLIVCLISCTSRSPLDSEESTVITDLTLTPSTVHAGDTILLDFTLGKQTFYGDPRTTGFGPDQTTHLFVDAGDVVPLLPPFFTPDATLPTFAAARDYADSTYGADAIYEDLGYQDNEHYYALLQAPDGAQNITLFFKVNGISEYADSESTFIRTTIEVLP